jgi:hypothetical protein
MMGSSFLALYAALLFLQTIHIFEEIGCGGFEIVGLARKYLVAASILLFASYLPFILILLDFRLGYYLAFFGATLALGNGIVHVIGFLRTRSFRGTIGAGVFSGIPLGILGGVVLAQLVRLIR